jgi:hypothetical protein
MINNIHLKRNKVLIKLTDGSSIYVLCYAIKKEIISSNDSKSCYFWFDFKSSNYFAHKNNIYNFYKKFSI